WDNPNRNRDRYRDRRDMALGHEKLDVYRLSIGYVAWVYEKADSLNSTGWPRCSAVSAEEATKFERIKRPTASIPIPIAISIPKKENPNKRMHWTLILRASGS
ncbi:MAG: hypothetical protein SWH68_04710, partial [Thermodesulfobacteriota bacterium]|nr:hypothetical protein [Thermodesulfobacteriota bacterium]